MTVVGLGTAAAAGAAVALAMTASPAERRPRRPSRRHFGAPVRSFPPASDPFDSDGSALFV